MAVPGKAGRIVAGVIVVAVIAAGVIMGFDPFGSNVPEGVDTDATEVRSVTMSGENYEVVDYNDVLYELAPENAEVFVLEDGVTRQFISTYSARSGIQTVRSSSEKLKTACRALPPRRRSTHRIAGSP